MRFLFCLSVVFAAPLIAQQSTPTISVTGAVARPLTLTPADFVGKANGQPLYGENGSFRLIIPNDKRGARSIRMLTSLAVVQLRK